MVNMSVTATVRDASGNQAAVTRSAIVMDQAWRNAQVLYVDKPGPLNTGVIPGIPRTSYDSLTLVPGQTYENFTLRNYLTPPTGTAKVTIRNAEIMGPPTKLTSGSSAIVRAWLSGHAPIRLEDCTIWSQAPSPYINGVMGYGFELVRCNVYNVIDAVSGFNNNTGQKDTPGMAGLVQQCWLHDVAAFNPDPNHSDGSHCDLIQLQGLPGWRILGNNLDAFVGAAFRPTYYGTSHANAAIMWKPDVANVTAEVRGNWINGGAISINVAHDGPDRYLSAIGSIVDNKFGRDQRLQGSGGNTTWTIKLPVNPDVTGTFTGNTYADTGAAVTVRRSA